MSRPRWGLCGSGVLVWGLWRCCITKVRAAGPLQWAEEGYRRPSCSGRNGTGGGAVAHPTWFGSSYSSLEKRPHYREAA